MGVMSLPSPGDSPAQKNGSVSDRNDSSSSSLRKTTIVYGSLDTTEKFSGAAGESSQQLSAKALLHSPTETGDKETPEDGKKEETCCTKFTSCRWVIGYMCCAARFSQSAIRQCIGLAVVCMTLRTAAMGSGGQGAPGAGANLSGTSGAGADLNRSDPAARGGRGGNAEVRFSEFTWSPEFEGLVLNAFNIGFFFSPIMGGHIAGKYGGKRVVLVALLMGSIATISLPVAARYNDIFVVVFRVIAGFFLGVVDPAIQALWSRWAPKNEKAQLTTCSYTGLSLAGIVTFFISGYLCKIDMQGGWPLIFYFFGGFALMCTIPWLFLVYDSPDQHPRILESERMLIARGKGQDGSNKKLNTPWKQMLTSGPLWAIMVAHMTYSWVTSWMMAYLPKYLRDVQKFEVDEDGLYSSLPYVGRLISGFVAGYLSDLVTRSGRLSTTRTRKLFQTAGCVSCALCTLGVGFLDHTNRASAVTLLVLSMTLQNLTSVAFRINHLDIAPRFAGVMMGITVTAAMAFSLTGPPITAAVVRLGATNKWLCLFIIVAALNLVGAVVFEIFGSGEVQSWAQPPKTDYNPMSVVAITAVDSRSPSPTEQKPQEKILTGGVHKINISEDSTGSTSLTNSDEDSDSCTTPPPFVSSHSSAAGSAFVNSGDSTKADQLSCSMTGKIQERDSGATSHKPPVHSVGQVGDTAVTPNGTVPKLNMLRKRVSSSDLQLQSLGGKVKQAAPVKPSLSGAGDAGADCQITDSE